PRRARCCVARRAPAGGAGRLRTGGDRLRFARARQLRSGLKGRRRGGRIGRRNDDVLAAGLLAVAERASDGRFVDAAAPFVPELGRVAGELVSHALRGGAPWT